MAPRQEALQQLLTPEAVRERAHDIYRRAADGKTRHFDIAPTNLAAAVDAVVDVTRATYPTLEVPLHSRWRHFEIQGRNLWAELQKQNPSLSGNERARVRFELAVISVLLDAGAGADWRFQDQTLGALSRSEGLAVASFRMFEAGRFSADPADLPLRVDADALGALRAADLAQAFQVTASNPLVGLDGRVSLLQRLGRELACRPEVFMVDGDCRLGGLFDHLQRQAEASAGTLPARDILSAILNAFNSIWPSGLVVDGVHLGDVGRYAPLRRDDESDGLVPFHKLSQWLAYSLVEPLEEAGVSVVELDQLTGLPEYRNGGLFIDTGVIRPKAADMMEQALPATSEPVVEWRALTVALLDILAVEVRRRLDRDARSLPLAAVLQGGTWAAGRHFAQDRRHGRPPFEVESDGTIF